MNPENGPEGVGSGRRTSVARPVVRSDEDGNVHYQGPRNLLAAVQARLAAQIPEAPPQVASTAKLRYASVSPQKARLVANLVRGLDVSEAIEKLAFVEKKSAPIIKKLVESAIANAESTKDDVDIDKLFVETIYVDAGPVLRRFRPRAQGRANRILKKTSHITVKLAKRQS